MLEPREGGRWYSECEDGSECGVGKVLAWDPPRRLLLAWQINGQWAYDPDFITEVEVTFTARGAKKTHVALEHRNRARYGVVAPQLRGMLDAREGWARTLELFAKEAAA